MIRRTTTNDRPGPPRGRDRSRRGAVMVEFVFAAVLLGLPLAAGMVDYSLCLQARHVLSRAAHEGVIRAINDEDAPSAALAYLERAGFDTAAAAVDVACADPEPGLGSEMTVTVTYDMNAITLVDWPTLASLPETIRAVAVGRHL